MERLGEIAKLYDKDATKIVQGLRSDDPMPAPIVLEREDGTVTLVAGNTRLCAARAMNVRPRVVYVRLDDEPAPSTKTDDADQEDDEAAAVPRDTKIKGKRAVINKPQDFRHEPHAPNARSIAKVDPSGYHGQHLPPGAKIKLAAEKDVGPPR